MRLKQRLKTFFRAGQSSESAVELLRMFILPFIKGWDARANVDDALGAFFGTNDRKFYHGRAKRDFKLPGLWVVAGDRYKRQTTGREIKKDQYMLLAVDRKDQTARVEITVDGKQKLFKLSRPELEFLKDYIEIRES